MTLQGPVTATSLKQANKEYIDGHSFIHPHIRKFYASILTSHTELMNPKQYSVKD